MVVITGFLWLGVALHLFPVYWMFTASLKTTKEIFTFPPSFWPKNPNIYIYAEMIRGLKYFHPQRHFSFWMYVKNSAILTSGIMGLQLLVCSLAAYSLSKLVQSANWNRILFLIIVGTIFIPSQVHLIPSYLILQNFPFFSRNIPKIPFTNIPFPHHSFIGSYWGVILPAISSPFFILLFKGFFDGIPPELINAARLDGASELGIFGRIVLPLSRPIFAVIAYFSFSSTWNSFLWPWLILGEWTPKTPLAVVMYLYQRAFTEGQIATTPREQELEFIGGWPLLMAMGIVQSIPVFIMFIIFREHLMKGIKLRGFK